LSSAWPQTEHIVECFGTLIDVIQKLFAVTFRALTSQLVSHVDEFAIEFKERLTE